MEATVYLRGLPAGGPGKVIDVIDGHSVFHHTDLHLQDPTSPLSAGITAWRILNDDPFYKLSVVSDQLEMQLATDRFQMYIPFISSKNLVSFYLRFL